MDVIERIQLHKEREAEIQWREAQKEEVANKRADAALLAQFACALLGHYTSPMSGINYYNVMGEAAAMLRQYKAWTEENKDK